MKKIITVIYLITCFGISKTFSIGNIENNFVISNLEESTNKDINAAEMFTINDGLLTVIDKRELSH